MGNCRSSIEPDLSFESRNKEEEYFTGRTKEGLKSQLTKIVYDQDETSMTSSITKTFSISSISSDESYLSSKIQQANDDMHLKRGQLSSQPLSTEYKQIKLQPIVKDIEKRAMSISELKVMTELIKKRCQIDNWHSTFDGRSLTAEQVNLHDFNYHVILPSTVPQGIILMGLKHRKYLKGQIISQIEETEEKIHQRPIGIVMEDCEGIDVPVKVKKGRFIKGKEVLVNNEVCGYPNFVKFKDGVRMSFKEVLNPEPTKSLWFISHDWNEPVLSFVERCDVHARSCSSSYNNKKYSDQAYWICAYAINQHEERAASSSSLPRR